MVQFKDSQTVACLQKKWLRNIPRLINILIGDMSIIGPKPVSVQNISVYNTLDQGRFAVRPGLIFPHYSEEKGILSPEEDIRFELDYIANWDLLTDYHVFIRFIKKHMLCFAGHAAKKNQNHDN